MQSYFGLIFDSSSIHTKKIESFKQRYDSKFNSNPYVVLTILPPFEIELRNQESYKKFFESLTDIVDSHLIGLNEIGQIQFNGLKFNMGKKGILTLTPKLSVDFEHLRESLHDFLKSEGVSFAKSKNINNACLPIGRFEYADQLESALEKAKEEFSLPFILQATSLVLFERNFHIWNYKQTIFEFNNNQLNYVDDKLWAI